MTLYFITGNEGKFSEARAILGGVEQLNEELPEIQELDAKKIIRAKLDVAMQIREGEFIVEDTSLFLDCMCGLPGPMIKWFLMAVGAEGVWRIAENMGNTRAEARVLIGYTDGKNAVHFFEGTIKGSIVAPRGSGGFGWDPIFQPEGHGKTFGEMAREEKNAISMRRIAFEKLKNFLEKQ